MFPSTFQTPRVLLRPIDTHDARPIFDGYAQDPEVSRYLTWHPHETIGETQAYVRAAIAATSSRTSVIVRQNGGDVIGAFDLRELDRSRLKSAMCLRRRPGVLAS